MEKRPRRTYTEEFKKQMADLYNAGKPRAEIAREYELTPSAPGRWISRINKTGFRKEKDNRSEAESELIALRKETARLRLENEILKKAALIYSRQSRIHTRALCRIRNISSLQGAESEPRHGLSKASGLQRIARHEKDLTAVKEAFEEGKETTARGR